MRKILFVLAVLAFTVSVPVYAAVNVGGTWVLTQMGPMGGEENWDVVITQKGKKLDVTATNTELEMMLSGTGTLKGSEIKFNLKGTDVPIDFIFEGKVNGKKMEGTREVHQDAMGGTMIFEPPSSDGGGKPSDDEIEKFNTWSAVMK